MSYKYKKKYSKKKKYYKKYSKYDPQEDFAFAVAVVVIILGYWAIQLHEQYPLLFWGAIILGTLAVLFASAMILMKMKRRFRKIRTLNQMKEMDWREFEYFIAFVFKSKGFSAKTRKGKNDGGIDVDATKDGQRYAIQCKKWRNYKVGVVELRAFIGAVNAEGDDVIGIFITTSRLTKEAQKYVDGMSHKLKLWDADNLEEYIRVFTSKEEVRKIQEKPNTETSKIICDKCGAEMVLREASKGQHEGEKFYGCSNFPECRNIINISQESKSSVS